MWLKGLQNCQMPHLDVFKKDLKCARQAPYGSKVVKVEYYLFFQTADFDVRKFCSHLSHKDTQYLIWNISQFLNGVAYK